MPIYGKIKDVVGWLNESASDLSEHLIQHQATIGLAGPLVEIGVHRGKYLSLLYGASANNMVIGIDGFFDGTGAVPMSESAQNDAMRSIENNVRLADPDLSRLRVHAANSMDINAGTLAGLTKCPMSFISVDGGHDYETVYHDLNIALPNLETGGIMALDDVFNAIVPGVAQAACRFLDESKHLAATFATCGNKVFVTTPSHHAEYLAICRDFAEAGSAGYRLQSKNLFAKQQQWKAIPYLCGHEVATFL